MRAAARLLQASLLWLLVSVFVSHGAVARMPQPALVFDFASGKVLLAHNAGHLWYPASLTKLMTAWLVFDAIERGKLSFDDVITISPQVVKRTEPGAAKYGLKAGEHMRVERMLTFLLVRSDADMALALAEAVAGSEKAFVRRMNASARRLGMSATHFTNPTGMFNPAQVTTARDLAVLARALYQRFLVRHPRWWQFFSRRVVMKNGRPLKNRNRLLFMMPEANGMKTGFLCASGFNLLASAKRNGRLLGVVVLGRRSAYNRALVARVLLEEGFRRLRAGDTPSLRLVSLKDGSQRPPDLRMRICRRRIVPKVRAADLAGWGVALGPFRSALEALGVVEAELIAAELADERRLRYGIIRLSRSLLKSGVVRLSSSASRPNKRRKRNFAGLIWHLTEKDAVRLCKRAQVHGNACSLLSPAEERIVARLLPAPRRRRSKALSRVPTPRRRPHLIRNLRQGTVPRPSTNPLALAR